ncbi:hypothetical protein GALL_153090 [mine drainage metagenome]|uniref:Uncharacterized protein n=1 Tax=mine drainage metagenome TaxID=410659 RepID=A0A1J5S3J8_9ZZZZ
MRLRFARLWRHKQEPEDLAQTLVDEFVRKINIDSTNTESSRGSFEDKVRLYQLAILLIAIMSEEKTTPKYLAVRTTIEKCFFSSSSDPDGRLLGQIQHAMAHLGALFNKNEEMSWARTWLAETGIVESNPVILAIFSGEWMSFYTAVVKSLRQIEPR